MMLMVVFGAGASFDSSSTYRFGTLLPNAPVGDAGIDYCRPPLAKDLFANRDLFLHSIDKFPQCKPIIWRLRLPSIASGQTSIESVLQDIQNEANSYAKAHRELAAVRCYLQSAILDCQNRWRGITHQITNQLALLREVERTRGSNERVCLVTFNYDTIVEEALDGLGYYIRSMEDYVKFSFALFKLHGSIDWGQSVRSGAPQNFLNSSDWLSVLRFYVDRAETLEFSSNFVRCDPNQMGISNGHAVFPAIAIPVEKKDAFVCPQSHLDVFSELIPQISSVLLIGWRSTESHFLNLLKGAVRRNFRLHIVAGGTKPGQQTQIDFCRSLPNNPPGELSIDPGGFTDFLESGRARAFLETL